MASESGGDAAGFATGAALDATYGTGTAERVRAAKVLVVGAGGVGCELVKNLACTGFASITLIDLDTVDVSNLNRQFLFRRHHVGKSKAVEAAASVNRMVPGTLVEGLMGDVKETRFDISFFKGFHLVCNALDNLEARRHVNRMCLAAEVPLVESGSTGFNGNVSVIGKGVECYDCIEKMPQKSYAVCTIRSTPDKPVHCVVWAKFLFDLIFGPDDDGNVLKDLDGVAPAESTANPAAASGTAPKGPDPPAAAKGRHNDDKNYNVVEPANVHMDDDGAEGEEGHRVSKSSAVASKTRRSSRGRSDAAQGSADVQMTDSPGEKNDASAMDPDAAAAAEGRQNDDKDYLLVEPTNVHMDDDGEGGDDNAAVLKSTSSPTTRGRRTSGAKSGAADGSKVRTRSEGTGKKGGTDVVEPNAAAAALGRLNHDKNYVVVEPSNVYMDDDGDDSENDTTAMKPSASAASGKGQRTKGTKPETAERRSSRTRSASKAKKPVNPAMEPNPAAAALGRLNHDKNYVVVEPSNVYMDDDGEDGVNEAAQPEPSDSSPGRELRTRAAKRAATERKNVSASADNKERKREHSAMEPDAAAAAEGRLNDDKNYVVVEPSNVYMDDDGEDGFNEAAKREPGISSAGSKNHSTKVAKHEAIEDASAHRGGKGKGRKIEDSPMDPDAAAAAEGRHNDDKNYLVVEPKNVYMDDDGEDGVNEAAKPEPGITTASAQPRTRSAKRTTTRRGDGHAGDVKKEAEDDKSAMDPDAAAAAEGRLNDDKNYLVVEPSNVYMDDDGEDGVNEAAKPEPGAARAGNERRTKTVRRTTAGHVNAPTGGNNKEIKDDSSVTEPDPAAAAKGRRRGDKNYVVVEPSNVYMDDDGEDGVNEAAKPEPGATGLGGERHTRSTRSSTVGHGEARRSDSAKESKKDHSAMEPDAAAAAEGRLNDDENYVLVEPSNVYMDDDGEDGMNEAAKPKPGAAGTDRTNRQSRKVAKTGKAGPASAGAGGEDDGKTAEGSAMDPDAAAAAEGRLNNDKNYVVVEPSNVYMDDDGEDGGEYDAAVTSGATAAASTRRQSRSAGQIRADANTDAGNKGKKTGNSAMEPDAAAAAEGRQDGDENYVLVEPSNVYMDDDGEDGVNSAAEADPSSADARGKRRSEKQPKSVDGSTPRRNEAGKEGKTRTPAMEPDAAAAARGRLNDDANYKVVEPANVHMDDDGELGPDGVTVARSGAGKRGADRPRDKHSTRGVRQVDGEDVETFALRVCRRVFVEDIESQIAMKDLWTERSPPLVYDVSAAASRFQEDLDKVDLLDQVPWTKERSAGVFKGVLQKMATTRRPDIGTLTFDKDDRDAMMFVTAASNLRSHAYGVPLQAPFTVKGIAGNIVHAVATTNAVVGGLVVLEALKIISNRGDLKDSKISYVCKAPMGNRSRKIINPTQLRSPKQKCFVCSNGQLHLSIDVAHATLRTLVFEVLKGKLGVLQPTVEVTAGDFNNTLYECGSGLEEDEAAEYAANLERTLASLRVHAGSQLTIKDFAQDFTFTLHVSDAAGRFDDRAPNERFSLDGNLPQNDASAKADQQDVDNVDDELEEVAVADAGAQKAKAVVAMTKVVKTTKVTTTVTKTISAAAVPRKRGLAGDADETAGEGPSAKKARSDGAV